MSTILTICNVFVSPKLTKLSHVEVLKLR
eukprot:UN03345